MSSVENEERTRLAACLDTIQDGLHEIDTRLNTYAQEIRERNAYMWDARRDMDHIEKIAVRQAIEQTMRSSEILREQQQKITKLKRSPYFGRFDFTRDDRAEAEAIYIGIHGFRDERSEEHSSMTGVPRSRRCSMIMRLVRRDTRRHRAKFTGGWT